MRVGASHSLRSDPIQEEQKKPNSGVCRGGGSRGVLSTGTQSSAGAQAPSDGCRRTL